MLAVAATAAAGVTVVRDARELRVKESDRIAALARELVKMGAAIEERPDGMVVTGGRRLHGAALTSGGDHRMAMARPRRRGRDHHRGRDLRGDVLSRLCRDGQRARRHDGDRGRAVSRGDGSSARAAEGVAARPR